MVVRPRLVMVVMMMAVVLCLTIDLKYFYFDVRVCAFIMVKNNKTQIHENVFSVSGVCVFVGG